MSHGKVCAHNPRQFDCTFGEGWRIKNVLSHTHYISSVQTFSAVVLIEEEIYN